MFNKAMGNLAALANEDQFFDRMLDRQDSEAEQRERGIEDAIHRDAISKDGEFYPWSHENFIERIADVSASDDLQIIQICEAAQAGEWDEFGALMRSFFTDYAEKMATIKFEKSR